MTDQPIDTEVVTSNQALTVRETQAVAPSNLFGADNAVAVVEKAGAVASALKDVVKRQGLISNIQGKEYPRCEAWTLLGTMLGVFPVLQWTRKLETGWEARVEAKTRDGATVGAAEAQCLRTERNWKDRDDFALRSMAQTRATAKALRMPLGFVMTLAGYEATPAEEMVQDHPPKMQNTTERMQKATPPMQKATEPEQTRKATEQTKTWMLKELKAQIGTDNDANAGLVIDFFQKCGAILTTETVLELPLPWVPVSKEELGKLQSAIQNFECGDEAKMPYIHEGMPKQTPVAEKPIEVPRGTTVKDSDKPLISGPVVTVDPSWLEVSGIIKRVTTKEGTNKRGPWTSFGIQLDGGDWYNTFSKRVGEKAKEGETVTLYYTEDSEGRFTAQEIV